MELAESELKKPNLKIGCFSKGQHILNSLLLYCNLEMNERNRRRVATLIWVLNNSLVCNNAGFDRSDPIPSNIGELTETQMKVVYEKTRLVMKRIKRLSHKSHNIHIANIVARDVGYLYDDNELTTTRYYAELISSAIDRGRENAIKTFKSKLPPTSRNL